MRHHKKLNDFTHFKHFNYFYYFNDFKNFLHLNYYMPRHLSIPRKTHESHT